MELSTIYKPIQKELTEVENQFKLLAESKRTVFPDLYKMLSHILTSGKVIRPALTLLAGRLYNYDTKLLPMATATELLHIATLVHDDAIDKAEVRRWRQTVSRIWGEDKAILVGDYLLAKAAEYAAATENMRVVKLFAETLATICQGELRQSLDAFNLELTCTDYLERISRKTASLFSMATETGAILSQAPEESIEILRDYGYNLGIAFQIVDDIMDFIGTEEELGKPTGCDLAQGTLTLPSVLLLEHYPEDNSVKKIFQNEDNGESIRRAIELVRNSSIVQECCRVASDYRDRACHNLHLLPARSNHQALVELANYVVNPRR